MAKAEVTATAQSLLDVLDTARWSRALFTTYSLSLSFLESFVLHRLEAVGCADITVLVDEHFYLESLSERQASLAGKSYRLIPISSSRSGIFHPKVAYLWGDDYDIITVGSGNLTYAGHGANCECIDFASNARDPGVFREFGTFLTALIAREDFQLNGCETTLRDYIRRSADRADRFIGEDSGALLIHSVSTSIGDQASNLLAGRGPFRRLVCVSPFHHPRADGLARLAKGVGARKVDVCLDPDGNKAPFDGTAFSNHKLTGRFVLPKYKESRSLHAKWYEFHGDTSFIMTGSVNATVESMWTTNNIEVAILRESRSDGGVTWVEKEPEKVHRRDFGNGERPFDGVVIVTLMRDGALVGRIAGVASPAGNWRAELVTMFNRQSIGAIQVEADGAFRCEVPQEVQDTDASVQLWLRRKDEVVAGWVSILLFLDESAENRGTRRALGRLSRGEALQGDVTRIVHWLMSCLRDAGGRMGASTPERAESNAKPERRSRWLTYDDWAAGPATPKDAISSFRNLFARALSALAAGPKGVRWRPKDVEREPGGGDGSEDGFYTEEQNYEVEFDAVGELLRVIDRVLEERPDIPLSIDLVLFKAEHSLRSITGSELDFALAARGMDWIRWVTRLALAQSPKATITPIVVAMAACVVGASPSEHASARASELRDVLRNWSQDWTLDSLRMAAEQGFKSRIFSLLNADKRASLISALNQLWEARTVLDDLKTFLKELEAGGKGNPTAALQQTLGTPVVKALIDGRHDKRSKYGTVQEVDEVARCPCTGCGTQINREERVELRRRRGIKCRGCGRAILWLGRQYATS